MKVLTFPPKAVDPATKQEIPLSMSQALLNAVSVGSFNKSVEENFQAGNLLTALKDLPEHAKEFIFEDQWQALMEDALLKRQYILEISNPLLHAIRDAKAFKPKN
jgi:hypothetical protein